LIHDRQTCPPVLAGPVVPPVKNLAVVLTG
jgi:hypothetical protein